MASVVGCKIIDACSDNPSDHLPIHCSLKLPKPQPCPNSSSSPTHHPFHFPRPRWEDVNAQTQYQRSLRERLNSVSLIDPGRIICAEDATGALNTAYDDLCSAMHEAARDAVSSTTSRGPRAPYQKQWWTADCTAARDRCRLFFRIWKEMGRPLHGTAYECYRNSRRTYRRECRSAANKRIQRNHHLLNDLYSTRNPRKFWSMVRKMRSRQQNSDAIDVNKLADHFRQKFAAAPLRNEFLVQTDDEVKRKFNGLYGTQMDITISELHVKRLIRKLRLGCASGVDGISAENLRYSEETSLPLHLSRLMTVCLRFGCLPDVFSLGLLIPILKKAHLNPRLPSNYRPITVSSITSKLLELYVSEKTDHRFDPSQFGFVPHRGTTTAISLAHDVSQYCVGRGSAVYLCSLDAEGAFDAIPFPVLFSKAAESMTDCCWRLMYAWYSRMHILVKWNGILSPQIPVQKGTRQGGLSSPLLFNLFYRDLIFSLNNETCGVTIQGLRYNAFCYADDVLLASTTPSGLQQLINTAVEYITRHGLRFNPAKTSCFCFGKSRLQTAPVWTIEDQPLQNSDHLLYLGATLKNDKGMAHVMKRIEAAQKSFYGLQGAGLCFRGVAPEVASHLYSVGVRSVLTYGSEALHISSSSLKKMKSVQGKLVKAFLGLRKTSHTTPLLQALKIPAIETSLGLASLNLLRSNLLYDSSASSFYSHLFRPGVDHENTLVQRCHQFACDHRIDILHYILDDKYHNECKYRFKLPETDGIVDSIRQQFYEYNDQARNIVQLLVNPF